MSMYSQANTNTHTHTYTGWHTSTILEWPVKGLRTMGFPSGVPWMFTIVSLGRLKEFVQKEKEMG